MFTFGCPVPHRIALACRRILLYNRKERGCQRPPRSQEMKMGYWIPLILITFVGGVTQTMAGFGSALVMMLVLPHLMPIVQAAAVNSIAGGFLSGALIWKYRDKLKPRFVLLTAVPYLIASVVTLQYVQKIETRVLAILFGAFLTANALYYLILAGLAHMRIGPITLAACPVISGISSALFGIGGPLMSLMYLEKYEVREEYNANLQLLFFIAAVINNVIRAGKGIITVSLLPSAAAAVAAILVGERAGLLLAGRMKPEFLRKMVYLMVLFSGVMTVINNL